MITFNSIYSPPFAYSLVNIYEGGVFITDNNFMQGFNKRLVQDKLMEIGMGDIAKKLDALSEKEIEQMIRSNPAILKKASEIMKGGKLK